MSMTHEPFKRALIAAGAKDIEDRFFYQDYLYELMFDGNSEKPVTEKQWETICDMQGKRKPIYASNSKVILENAEKK